MNENKRDLLERLHNGTEATSNIDCLSHQDLRDFAIECYYLLNEIASEQTRTSEAQKILYKQYTRQLINNLKEYRDWEE